MGLTLSLGRVRCLLQNKGNKLLAILILLLLYFDCREEALVRFFCLKCQHNFPYYGPLTLTWGWGEAPFGVLLQLAKCLGLALSVAISDTGQLTQLFAGTLNA